jgi:DNA-binding transcriptional LysR family regulator
MILDTRRLRYFVATAEELHFGKAAQRLGISQPPLSVQIRTLEQELGVELLERNQRNVALTKAGEVLFHEARKILLAVDQAALLTQRTARGLQGSLSVGFNAPADYGFLPELVRAYRQQFPSIALQVRNASTDEQIEELRNRQLDVGLLSQRCDDSHLECQEVAAEPLIAAIPVGHPLSTQSTRLSIKRLADEELVMFPRQTAPVLFDEIVGFCREADFSPRIAQESRQTQAVISLVAAGLGIGIVPTSIRHMNRKGVVYRSFREQTPRARIYAAWSRNQPSAAIANFVALARKTASLDREALC